MVEIPGTLYAGFHWTLRRLQRQSVCDQPLAFSSAVAPPSADASYCVSPPQYTINRDFSFHLDVLSKGGAVDKINQLTMKPAELVSDQEVTDRLVKTLCKESTFDEGQAKALCESLCRDLAFTQGPPGTGKTFLGVGLTRVLLASRQAHLRRPILIVCMTNHALDSFLNGLREAGILGLARLGTQSKEDWTKHYQLGNLARRVKKTTFEKSSSQQVRYQIEALTTEGRSWCEALNDGVVGWPAVREHLQAHHTAILSRFTEVEKSDQSNISDIRLARKAGGFAFKYWCEGGDISDINLLIERFSSLLGSNGHANDFHPRHLTAQERIHRNIEWNAKDVREASNGHDVWKLTLPERKSLLEEWKSQIKAQLTLDRTAEVHRRHQDAISRRRNIQSDFEARILQDVDIIATTTTSCAMNWPKLLNLGLKVVVCEEAGEVMEAQFLCTLFPTVEHAISIGDPLQLRPQVNEQCLSLETLRGSKYRLDESLMERLMLPTATGVSPIPSSRLNIQRRMHPEIADIMRTTLYPYLVDHQSTANHEKVAGLADRIFWLDHRAPEDFRCSLSVDGTSSSNTYEVEMVTGMVKYLVSSNEYEYRDITILTPYNGQLAAFTENLKGVCSLWLSDKDREALISDGFLSPGDLHDGMQTDISISNMLRLATIDNFQGEESKIIILSIVRSNDAGRVGFMKNSNRINVACSRARNGFYIVGNAKLMATIPIWRQITSLFALKGKIGPAFRICCPRHPKVVHYVHESLQWDLIPSCQALCEFEFACGHQCGIQCHPLSFHERTGCTKPCEKVHDDCGHVCAGLCGQPCGNCTHAQLLVKLPCGHDENATCAEVQGGKTEETVVCKRQLVSRHLKCGHVQDVICGNARRDEPCRKFCGATMDCGHQCEGFCFKCTLTGAHPNCQAVCQKAQSHCPHLCAFTCHSGSDCPPCQQPCERLCRHGGCHKVCSSACDPCTQHCDWACEHEGRCTSLCCLPCTRLPCSKRCAKTLYCGHTCPSLCGERCANVCLQCTDGSRPEKIQMFLVCGHRFDLDFLDNFVGIHSLYQVDIHGSIQAVTVGLNGRMGSLNLQCPICHESCAQLRRYSLYKQLCDFGGVVDRLCAQISQKIDYFLKRAYATMIDLDATFPRFQETMKPGPLTGKADEIKIRERGSALDELQNDIIEVRGRIIKVLSFVLEVSYSHVYQTTWLYPSKQLWPHWHRFSMAPINRTARRCRTAFGWIPSFSGAG